MGGKGVHGRCVGTIWFEPSPPAWKDSENGVGWSGRTIACRAPSMLTHTAGVEQKDVQLMLKAMGG